MRAIVRLIVVVILAFVILVVLFRLVAPPSTLMLGRWLTLQPVTREWVPLGSMSPDLIKAVIAAEDQRFCGHRGIDWIELQDVLEGDGLPERGASTLTMQTVKNLFLWPGRSVVRKGLELPLALVADAVWGKRRTLEIYLNIAEWGDGIFGAQAAARHHFGKTARELRSLEAARLAASLPNPVLRNPGNPAAGLRAATRRVLQRMADIDDHARCVLR